MTSAYHTFHDLLMTYTGQCGIAWTELHPLRGEDLRKEPESIASAAISHTTKGRLAGTTGGPWILVVCWGHGTYIENSTSRICLCEPR